MRLPKLAQRPMHTDEAIHAIKFGSLLEDFSYQYDPYEYHGPTLNFFSLVPAWFKGTHKLVNVSESDLRIVPVFWGLFLLVLLLSLKPVIPKNLILISAFFMAISPALVYYSRYYIQETLFISFSFAIIVFFFRFMQKPKWYWAMLCGIFIGLLHATKETCILFFAALFLSLFIIWLLHRNNQFFTTCRFKYFVILFFSALITSILFFSSFFTHPQGILDSVLTFKSYFERGTGNHFHHIHPWYYYLKLFIWNNYQNRPLWTEAFFLFFSIIGIGFVFKPQEIKPQTVFLRFLSLLAIIQFIIYSNIPYKTPWSILSAWYLLVIMAGYGVICIYKTIKNNVLRILFMVFVGMGILHIGFQTYMLNFKYDADLSNPYVYGHTSYDIYKVVDAVEKAAQVHQDSLNMYIEIIASGDDYWPFPWYLRSFKNVAYRHDANFQLPLAPVILASPELENQIMQKIYTLPKPGERNLYVPLFDSYLELRPFVEFRGYIVKDLWDKL